jgi:hypothetical protein
MQPGSQLVGASPLVQKGLAIVCPILFLQGDKKKQVLITTTNTTFTWF